MMYPVAQRLAEPFSPALAEGKHQQHGALHVVDQVDTAVETRQHPPGFRSRQRILRNRHQQRPFDRNGDRKYADGGHAVPLGSRWGPCQDYTAVPAGSDVIRMTFARRSFRDDSLAVPFEGTEPCCHGHAGQHRGSRRTASHAQRNVIVQANRERSDLFPFALQQLAIGIDDEIAGHLAALICITPTSVDGELCRRKCLYPQPKIKRQRGCVECRSEIRRGRRKKHPELHARWPAWISHLACPPLRGRARLRRHWRPAPWGPFFVSPSVSESPRPPYAEPTNRRDET